MRGLFPSLFLALLLASPGHAAGKMTTPLNVQQECAEVGDIAFGAKQRWADCSVTRGRWVATIDIIDMYQAQYCLGSGEGATCAQRALLIFGNRAYTPDATLLIQRIDAGDVEYDDPLVIQNNYGRILTISAHFPGGGINNRYFLWQVDKWVPIDTQRWLQALAKQLPRGVTAREGGWPDVDTMSTTVRLFRKTDPAGQPSAGVANIELGLAKNRFVVKKIRFSPSTE